MPKRTSDTCPRIHALVDALVAKYGLAEDGADFRVYLRQEPYEDLLLSRRDDNWLVEIGYVVRGRPDGVTCLIADSRGDCPETWHPVGMHQFIIGWACAVHGGAELSTQQTAEIRDYAEQCAAVYRKRVLEHDATVITLPVLAATRFEATAWGGRVVVQPPSY